MLRGVPGEPAPDRGVEGHDRHRTDIVREGAIHRSAQRGDPSPRRFQLDEKRRSAGDQPKHLGQSRDRLRRAAQPDPGQGLGGEVANRSFRLGQPLQPVVMEDHRLAVGARLDVELDSVAGVDRCLEGGPAILDSAVAVQSAMRERPRNQSLDSKVPIPL